MICREGERIQNAITKVKHNSSTAVPVTSLAIVYHEKCCSKCNSTFQPTVPKSKLCHQSKYSTCDKENLITKNEPISEPTRISNRELIPEAVIRKLKEEIREKNLALAEKDMQIQQLRETTNKLKIKPSRQNPTARRGRQSKRNPTLRL
jgi:hypothetical protein